MINYDEDIEKNILSGLINYPTLIFTVELFEEDFYFEKHKLIFNVLKELKGKAVDILIVSRGLSTKELKKVGGMTYIAGMVNAFITKSTFNQHVKILKDKSIRRKIETAQKINLSILADENKETTDLLSEVQKNIMDINIENKEDASGKNAVNQLIKAQVEYSEKYEHGNKHIGIPCGIEKLDSTIDGLRKGHVWVIGAWASTGKSSFLLNIIHNIAKNTPTALISLEMGAIDIVSKIISIRHGISTQGIIKGMTNDDNLDKIEDGKSYVYNSKLNIYTKYFELEQIKMLIRKEVYTRKTKVIAIDYVQNIIGQGMREYELLTKVAIDMQSIARELEITIILLSQVSNESVKGNGAGAGFKGTGAFEAVADLAIRLYRNKENEKIQDKDVPLFIKIEKNRHGFTGLIDNYNLELKSGKLLNKVINPFIKL